MNKALKDTFSLTLMFFSDCEKIEFGRNKVDQRILDSFIKNTLKILEKLDLSIIEGGMLQEVE